MNQFPVNIIITGGGTGGHLFPGIAIAEEFKLRNNKNNILFAGTGNEFEKRILKEKFTLKTVRSMGIKGMGVKAKIKSILTIPKGMLDSFKIIRNFKPDMVIGMGGYSSGPVILTAWLLGIKTAIHEQNTIAGITNRILGPIVDIIFTSFAKTKALAENNKLIISGNPVRKVFLQTKKIRKDLNSSKDISFTVLITGGSQGAHSINLAMIDALQYLKNKENIYFIHQTGKADAPKITKSYIKNGIKHTVQPFFNNMDELYQKANLIICRAGATTIAEITAMGKAAIFIPFPFAADNHQECNAKALVDNNAAFMILEKNLLDENKKFNGKKLMEKIILLSEKKDELKTLEKNLKKFGKNDAAKVIVDQCYKIY